MNDTPENVRCLWLMEFIDLFALPGEVREPVTLEGKVWDEALGKAVPSGEMVTWAPKHPPLEVYQIEVGINPTVIVGRAEISTVWNRVSGKCVFSFYRPKTYLPPVFYVDERGVRSVLEGAADGAGQNKSPEEQRAILEEIQRCRLTFPASLNEVRAWGERMGYPLAESPLD